jgi:phosphoenolpyruvate carboxylase
LYEQWPFFRAVIDNAQQEMARARPVIAEFYHQLSEIDLSPFIIREFEQTREAILSITGQTKLLDNRPVIQKSIFLRNPYTDVLNLVQVELLRRWHETGENKRKRLAHAIFLSINGIAAAMQSTG